MLQHYLVKEKTQKTAYWCIVRATQSNFCSALNFFSPELCPNSPELNALITRFRESYSSMIMSHESKRLILKRLKKPSSKWLSFGTNTAFK